MHIEKSSGRALRLDLFFRDGFYFYFLVTSYFRILFLYATDFNSRINKDIIIVSKFLLEISSIIILIFYLKMSFICSYLSYQFSAPLLLKSSFLQKKYVTFNKLMKSINTSIANLIRRDLVCVRIIC